MGGSGLVEACCSSLCYSCTLSLRVLKGQGVKVRIRAKCSILEWQCMSVISDVMAFGQYVTYVSGYSMRKVVLQLYILVLTLILT